MKGIGRCTCPFCHVTRSYISSATYAVIVGSSPPQRSTRWAHARHLEEAGLTLWNPGAKAVMDLGHRPGDRQRKGTNEIATIRY